MNANRIKKLTTAALLCAIGILIPQIMPKIVIPPASFTPASHVAVMIAMFISPAVGIAVALVTSLGFLMNGLPIVIVFRALSHLVFVTIGAFILKKYPGTLKSFKTMVPFALLISIVHAICEVLVSTIFFTGVSSTTYLVNVIGLVGLGTIIHSLVDFSLAILVWVPVQRVVAIPVNANVKIK